MKKLVITAIALAILLASCDIFHFRDSIIANESSYDVTFKAKKADQITLKSGQSVTIQNDIGAVLERFESSPMKRVDYIQIDVYKGKFVDLPSIPVVINNTMAIPVTLSAGGYLGTDPMPNIQTGENNTNTIYTRTPVLTVITNSFPATADYQVVDDTMYIIIK